MSLDALAQYLQEIGSAKDLYDIEGKHRKININMNYEDALTYADDDINENWQIYRHRFLEGDMS